MTIEEAIQHCKDVATENRQYALEFARVNVYDSARNCQECAAEHEQLAEWLTELKQRREAEITAPPKSNADRIRQMTDEELSVFLGGIADNCSYNTCDNCPMYGACVDVPLSRDKWLKQEVSEDAAERTD